MEDELTVPRLPKILKLNIKNCFNKNNNISTTHRNKNILVLKNYFQNSYNLESQAVRNSFGKMILSKSESSPSFSFGKEKRFYQYFKEEEIVFYKKLFDKIKNPNKGILTHRIINPLNFENEKIYLNKIKSVNLSQGIKSPSEFLYCLPPTNIYKYPFLPKFSFGKSLRDLQKPIKKYDFYKLNYDKKLDDEIVDKKWRKRIVGGNIGIEERFVEDKKFYDDSLTPGPGKYNPDYESFKYKQNKYGYMGIKLNEDKNYIITNRPKNISLNSYNIKQLIGTLGKNNHTITNNSNISIKNKNIVSIKNIEEKLFQKENYKKGNGNGVIKFPNMKNIFRNKLFSKQNNLKKRTNISVNT